MVGDEEEEVADEVGEVEEGDKHCMVILHLNILDTSLSGRVKSSFSSDLYNKERETDYVNPGIF